MQNKKKIVVIIVMSLVVVLVLGGAFSFLLSSKQQDEPSFDIISSEPQDEISSVILNFKVQIQDYESQSGSGVPVQIYGTDIKGSPVSEMVLIGESLIGLELPYGDYAVKVVGSPVSSSGVIYKVSSAPTLLKINDSGVFFYGMRFSVGPEGESAIELPSSDFNFIEPEFITDEEIEAVRSWMQEFEFEESRINEFILLIQQTKREAVKNKRSESSGTWRTRISGDFWGSSESFHDDSSISVYFDGLKVTVTGGLQRNNGSGSTPLQGNEWHFMLTDNTVYGFNQDEFHETSREYFRDNFLPSRCPSFHIAVEDGYITRISVSS